LPRPRIATAKPIYQVKPLKINRPKTTESILSLPDITSAGRRPWSLRKHKVTDEIENQTIEKLEYGMEGLNCDQRDSVLQALYQTQVVRDKYNLGKDYQEEDDEEILEFMDALCFPIDDSVNIVTEEERQKAFNLQSPGGEEPQTPKAMLWHKPKPKYGKFIDPRNEVSDGDGEDRINNAYIHKVRKVTIDVQKWVEKSLDDPVDLASYIDVNIHGLEKAEEKADPVQVENAKNVSNTFRTEMETALTSWKPQFLNKKKGKMLNVIGESMAPTMVVGNMSKVIPVVFNHLDVQY
jgi:hypothetical protein